MHSIKLLAGGGQSSLEREMRKIGKSLMAVFYAAAVLLGIVVGIGTDQALDTDAARTAATTKKAIVLIANLDTN